MKYLKANSGRAKPLRAGAGEHRQAKIAPYYYGGPVPPPPPPKPPVPPPPKHEEPKPQPCGCPPPPNPCCYPPPPPPPAPPVPRGIIHIPKTKVATGESTLQADWAETDESKRSYIKNKPTALSAFENDILEPLTETDVDELYADVMNE